MTLRCTATVLGMPRVPEPAIGQAGEEDRYAHLIWVDRCKIDRRKCPLATHAGTLFSVFMPNVTATGLRTSPHMSGPNRRTTAPLPAVF